MIKIKYETTDGRTFTTITEAKQHQSSLVNTEELIPQVLELLNKVVVILDKVPKVEVDYSDDDESYRIRNIDAEDLKYLASIKDICERTIANKYNAISMCESYYDSSCY